MPTDPARVDRRLDGNAIAGPSEELLAVDPAAALETCAHCGGRAAVGEQDLHGDVPAYVLHCPGCTDALLPCGAGGSQVTSELSGPRLVSALGAALAASPGLVP
jgi:hypothetical protein